MVPSGVLPAIAPGPISPCLEHAAASIRMAGGIAPAMADLRESRRAATGSPPRDWSDRIVLFTGWLLPRKWLFVQVPAVAADAFTFA
jgi:hypothetical protein